MRGLFSDAMPPERAQELASIMRDSRPVGMRTVALSLAEADLRAHVAVGEGRVGHYCVPGPYLCFSTLSIDASDRLGAFGHAVYAGQTASIPFSTNIAFTCVVIKDITGGHTLYASGTGIGTNPGTYFVNLTVYGTSSYYGVSQGSTGGYCGAGGLQTSWALGAFQIAPVG